MFYKLIDHIPVKCATGREWADWYETTARSGERRVAYDELDGGILVSTIFTGVDLEVEAIDPRRPRLFETMTFMHGEASGIAIRSATWEAAERQHRKTVP